MPPPGSDEEVVILTMTTAEIWDAVHDGEGNPLYPVTASRSCGASLALALPRSRAPTPPALTLPRAVLPSMRTAVRVCLMRSASHEPSSPNPH